MDELFQGRIFIEPNKTSSLEDMRLFYYTFKINVLLIYSSTSFLNLSSFWGEDANIAPDADTNAGPFLNTGRPEVGQPSLHNNP